MRASLAVAGVALHSWSLSHVTQKSVFKRFLALRAGVRNRQRMCGRKAMVCVLISEQTSPCISPKSSAIALGNHRMCCDFGRISLLLSLSERKKTQVVFGA